MATVTVQRTMDAPVNQVWRVATDVADSPRLLSGVTRVEMLTRGDFGVGTRWRETREMFGRETTEEMWVTACEPEHSYTVECDSGGTHYVSTFTFAVKGDTTTVTLTFTAQPAGHAARLIVRLLGTLMFRPVARQLRQDLDDVARWVERTR